MEDQNAQFLTATVLNWMPLLRRDSYKRIIVDSMDFLVQKRRCDIYAFVIMPNHIHLIWRVLDGHKRSDVQRDFLKFTSQKMRYDLVDNHPDELRRFEVNKSDRRYQFWQRRPLSIDIYSRYVMEQKLDYIHGNPVQPHWNLVNDFVDYKYSSASFYEEEKLAFPFLRHYLEDF